MSDIATLATKIFRAVADELNVELQAEQVQHLMAGNFETAGPSALQIAQEVCQVVAFLNADVCPLVPKKS